MSDGDDVKQTASKWLRKLSSVGREAAGQVKQAAQQVTGLGRGEIRLELDHTRIAPGGVVRGRVVLALPEEVDGKRLVVALRARVGGSHAELFQLERELAGGQFFVSGSHDLALDVPPDALELRAPAPGTNATSAVAEAVRSVASAISAGGPAGPVEWQVSARLEVPWGRDLTSTVDITVAR